MQIVHRGGVTVTTAAGVYHCMELTSAKRWS